MFLQFFLIMYSNIYIGIIIVIVLIFIIGLIQILLLGLKGYLDLLVPLMLSLGTAEECWIRMKKVMSAEIAAVNWMTMPTSIPFGTKRI